MTDELGKEEVKTVNIEEFESLKRAYEELKEYANKLHSEHNRVMALLNLIVNAYVSGDSQ